NPQTGEPVKIKASNTVAFKPGKSLKDICNNK
ncbi:MULTISPECIES: HU family DNA-binding protein, partial [unclassified Pseudomonas]